MDQTSETNFRNRITLMAFIASLFVIFAHSTNLEGYGITGASVGFARFVWMLESWLFQIFESSIPVFFFLSGFQFFRGFSWETAKRKYQSRFRSVVIPYLVWCSIYYFWNVITTHAPIISNYINSAPAEVSLQAWLRALWPDSYYTLWFLKNLMIFIALTPVLYILLKDRWKLPTGLAVVILLVLNSLFPTVYCPNGLPVFAAGGYIAINHKGAEYYKNPRLSIACAVISSVLAVTNLLAANDFFKIVFVVTAWQALDLVSLETEFPWWMKITFFTYAAHDLLLVSLNKLILVIFGRSPVFALVNFLICPPIVFLLLVFAASILRKNRFLWSLLCGGRGTA
ncbi:MAG: acyltransferase family protein [Solobacterium sp.]|nr:acyltransferase family protein [Solobacterium sp.]